ncbi:hypothetical protein GUJ93_ZPchr0006g42636 [Zizania palustris]|uniref:Secreted protein n=1 Tax=Zizania palustris TaxID=103762 RepID=A0A8J5T5P6_ZIZPA|nr:hypothetical protein GUJ93_ZPchr0006g42636 [Zizania palustris]
MTTCPCCPLHFFLFFAHLCSSAPRLSVSSTSSLSSLPRARGRRAGPQAAGTVWTAPAPPAPPPASRVWKGDVASWLVCFHRPQSLILCSNRIEGNGRARI